MRTVVSGRRGKRRSPGLRELKRPDWCSAMERRVRLATWGFLEPYCGDDLRALHRSGLLCSEDLREPFKPEPSGSKSVSSRVIQSMSTVTHACTHVCDGMTWLLRGGSVRVSDGESRGSIRATHATASGRFPSSS